MPKTKELTFVNDCFEYERNDLLDIIDKLYLCVPLQEYNVDHQSRTHRRAYHRPSIQRRTR